MKYWVGLLVVVGALQGALGYGLRRYHLTLNVGHSLPGQLYACRALQADDVLTQGMVVYYVPPARVQATIRQIAPGADLRLGWLKRIAAQAGDEVCWADGHVLVNQEVRGELPLLQDYPLPVLRTCQALGTEEVLTMGVDTRSFDGRYTGPITREEVQDVCYVLW